MKPFLCVLFAAAAFGAPASAPADSPWRFIHPNAGFIMGVNWRSMAQSQFARSLRQQFAGGRTKVTGNIDFIDRFDSLLLSAPVPEKGSADPKEGLMVIQGSFDLAKLRRELAAKGGRSQLYDGVELWSAMEMSIGVLDNATLLAGDRRNVTAAIRGRDRLAPSSALLDRARTLSSSASAWLVASGAPAQMKMPGLRAVAASVLVRENAEITLDLDTDAPQQVAALVEMLARMDGKVPQFPMRVTSGPSGVQVAASVSAAQLRSGVERFGRSMAAGLLGRAGVGAAQTTASAPVAPARPAEEAPLPPEKQVVKIYGLDEGVREVPLNRK